jgi:hypothetical protein
VEKIVAMLIICWTPENGVLKEAWRIEKLVTLDHCLIMNGLFTGGGTQGAITVRCKAE